MSPDAREALQSPGVAELIITEWCAGRDTMRIAESIIQHLKDAGEVELPTLGEAEAFAHNLPGRLGACAAFRRMQAHRAAQANPFHAAGGSAP